MDVHNPPRLDLQYLLLRRAPFRMLDLLHAILRLMVVVVVMATCSSAVKYTDFYVPVTFDNAGLQASTVRKETLTGISRQRCVSLAVIKQWPILVCHSLDAAQMCTMWDLETLNAVTVTKDRTLGATKCMMTDEFIACKSTVRGLVRPNVPMEEFECPSSPYKFLCSEGNGIEMVKVAPSTPLSGCSAPFVSTPVGCIFVSDTPVTFSEARMTCLEYGTELVSPDSLDEFLALQDYLKANTPGTSEYWGGLVRLNWAGDDWMWLGNGRHPGADLAIELVAHSNDSAEWYARFQPSSYAMNDASCFLLYGFVCEAKGV